MHRISARESTSPLAGRTTPRVNASRWMWMVFGLTLAALVACRDTPLPEATDGAELRVVTTTTMLADLAARIAPDGVVVESLIPHGADPHVWQPRPSDVRRIRDADVVIRNGLWLEGWIDGLLAHAGPDARVITASARVPNVGRPGVDGADPHFWFDVSLWMLALDEVEAQLADVVPPASRDELHARARAHRAELHQLHAWVGERIASIPEEHRVLVTSHDAFGWFGAAYGLDVHGVQGMSTGQEASQRDLLDLIRLVRSRDVPALFVETSVSPVLVHQVARETGARVAGPLHSDSLAPPGAAGDSYVGMVRDNVRQLVEALGGHWQDMPPART